LTASEWQVIITAAGNDDSAFIEAGFSPPKNLVTYQNREILQWALSSYAKSSSRTDLIIRKSEAVEHKTDVFIKKITPKVHVHQLQQQTRGALCSALLGIEDINLELPLVIAPGDSYIEGNVPNLVEQFLNGNSVAGTIVFESNDPRWSYARVHNNGEILEMAEKSVISRSASTGIFMFRTAQDFLNSAAWVLLNNMQTNNEFYISAALNYLIMSGKSVTAISLPSTMQYFSLSKPSDLNFQIGSEH
jgi:dTDP-glucose pyrophosphorylase